MKLKYDVGLHWVKGCSTVQNIVIEIGMEQTRLFQCNRCRRSAEPKPFFSGSGWSLWIFMSRACCAWRNNQYILAAEIVITNAACAAAVFIYLSSSSMINMSNYWYQQFELLISTIQITDISNYSWYQHCWYQQLRININFTCHSLVTKRFHLWRQFYIIVKSLTQHVTSTNEY